MSGTVDNRNIDSVQRNAVTVIGERRRIVRQLTQRLDCATGIDEVLVVRKQAESLRRQLLSGRASLAAQNEAAAVRLRAERAAGRALAALKLRGGDRKSNDYQNRPTLADLGISQNQSKRWQRAASVPEDEFRRFLAQANRDGEEVTTARLLKLAEHAGGRSRRVSRSQALASDPTGAYTMSMASPHAETTRELACHVELLTSILTPYLEGKKEPQLGMPDARMIKRLTADIAELVRNLDAA